MQDATSLLAFAPSKSHDCGELYRAYVMDVMNCMIADELEALHLVGRDYRIDSGVMQRTSSASLSRAIRVPICLC
jgi:hypothetical protein